MFPFCCRTIVQCRIHRALAVQSINMASVSLNGRITSLYCVKTEFFLGGGGSEDDLDLNNSVLVTIVIFYHGCHLAFPCMHLSATWQVDANLVSFIVICSHNGGSLHQVQWLSSSHFYID